MLPPLRPRELVLLAARLFDDACAVLHRRRLTLTVATKLERDAITAGDWT